MDYKEEIIEMIQKCNNLHWLKVIHAYVFKIVRIISEGRRDWLPFVPQKGR